MAKKLSRRVTLTMTVEEAKLVSLMLSREESRLEDRIAADILPEWTQEARKNLLIVQDLHYRVKYAYFGAEWRNTK